MDRLLTLHTQPSKPSYLVWAAKWRSSSRSLVHKTHRFPPPHPLSNSGCLVCSSTAVIFAPRTTSSRRTRSFCKIGYICLTVSSRCATDNPAAHLFFAVFCNRIYAEGSPSRIRMVRRISFGMTTRPRSSIFLTIPVAFISQPPPVISAPHIRSIPFKTSKIQAKPGRFPYARLAISLVFAGFCRVCGLRDWIYFHEK